MYEIYCDTRLGGTKRWSVGPPKRVDMRVPDPVILSVCFLCARNATGDYVAVGTGFFVNVKSEKYPDNRFIHLVTAKHLIEKSQDLGLEDLHARINKKPSGVDYVKIQNSSWLFHEDPNVDVAVIPFSPPLSEFEYADIDSVDMFATGQRLVKDKVGVGDELQMVGLFSRVLGHEKNHPIVRIGSLAAMPGPIVLDERGREIKGYLADMRSVGGHSGSPVFVVRKVKEETMVYLLGLVHGHWDFQLNNPRSQTEPEDIWNLNHGIAIITPIQRVWEILMSETLKDFRKNADTQKSLQNAPTADVPLDRTKKLLLWLLIAL